MSVTRRLYQLQEIDLEIESHEQKLGEIMGQLKESPTVIAVRNQLSVEGQKLEELKSQQHSAEWEIEDLTTRINEAESKLYSGQIPSHKELANLQQDIDMLRARRNQLEDKALEIMEQGTQTEASVANISSQLRKLEAEWQREQEQLAQDMARLKAVLSDLNQKRQQLLAQIDPDIADFYHRLKKQKKQAMAKVEQGICHGCRISLSTSLLQQARGSHLVQCSNCGRILFVA